MHFFSLNMLDTPSYHQESLGTKIATNKINIVICHQQI